MTAPTGTTGGLDPHSLSVRYGARPILRGVTVPDLRPGTITALIGPGKSTLLRGLAGFPPRSVLLAPSCSPSRLAPLWAI